MSSNNKREGSYPSNSLRVPNSDQDRAIARLENIGKNDSVKSTYSLSVFLDPDASKDMVRQEELWYPMNDPNIIDNPGLSGMNQYPRTATPSVAAGSKKALNRLTLTHEKKEEELMTASNQLSNHRQKEELLRNGSRSTTSTAVASRSAHKGDRSGNESWTDTENHFNRNTFVQGVQSGGGGRAGAGRAGGSGRGGATEELGYEVRRWSTERSLPKASKVQDTEDYEHGEEVAEQEEIGQTMSRIEATSRAPPPGLGVGTSSEEEDVVDYVSRVEKRSDFRHLHDTADGAAEENGDRNSNGIQAGQGASGILYTSNSAAEEDADGYDAATQRRRTSERIRSVSNVSNSAVGDDEAVNYNSAMQPRTSSGQVSSRSQPTNFTDHDRSSNAVTRDASVMQMTQRRNALDEEDSTLTEGSGEGVTGKSYYREPIPSRAKFNRATAVDGKDREIGQQLYQNGHSDMTSARRNNSSVPSLGEMSDKYEERRNGIGFGREDIRWATSQSEAEVGRTSSPTSRGGPSVRRRSQDESSEDDANWNLPGGTLSRQKDQNSSTYNNRRRAQDGSSEGESDGLRHGIRQPTPAIRLTTPSSSSYTESITAKQQVPLEEDNCKTNVRRNASQVVPTPRSRGSASNGVRNAPVANQNLTSEEEEAVRGSDLYRTQPGQISNSPRPGDVSQYQPRPAERKKLGAAGYSSPREPYTQNSYTARASDTRGRESTDTDSVLASDDSITPSHTIKGNASTRKVYRERGYPTYAINSEVQPRSATYLNAAGLSEGYSDSSLSNPSQRRQHRRLPANQTMGYSDESDIENNQKTRSSQRFMMDFPSESEDQEGYDYSKRKTTTTVKKTKTPVTGVVRVTPEPSSREEVVQEKIIKTMKTMPVTGVVSIPEAEPRQRLVERNRTPIVGLISVSRSPSPDRTKTPVTRETITKTTKTTPVTGVIGIPDVKPRQRQTVASSQRNQTPVVGLISVSRSPSPDRTKTPVVGVISVQQSHTVASTARSPQPITGQISVSSNTQFQRRSATPAAQLIPDINNNSAYPGKFRHQNRTGLASTYIETLAVPNPETQAEIVGVDPELKGAQKTRSNHYQITMNLRPVVGESSELGYEVYNTAVGRATPMSLDRLRVNGSRADWRNSEGEDGFYFRPPTVMSGTLGSRPSSVRAPSSQLGFVSSRSNRVESSTSRLHSVSSQGRIVNPSGKQAYIMGPGRLTGNSRAENLYLHDIPRSYSAVGTNRSRSLSRQGTPQHLRNTLLQVPPILQTVTSRPRRLSSDAVPPSYDHVSMGGGRRQNRCSSTMSSVFLSPTLERRYNRAGSGPSSFRDDTIYRYGRFT